jgi:serine/threonine protein kinase
MRIRPGRVIRSHGHYRFVRRLGVGGMGEVWLVEKQGSHGFNKLMAIKTIHRSLLRDHRTLEMFLDEARLVANLVHPNIVQVFQLYQSRKEVFIIMEHVFGVPLLRLLERLHQLGRPLPIPMATHIAARICHGLHYAHNKRDRDGRHLEIVHRDICPSNILISFRGIPKLTDFGVAKASSSTVDDEGNVVWGKYPYMAPEAANRLGTDARSDLYSLGLVLHEALTGKVAHQVESTRALTDIIAGESPEQRDPRGERPDIPEPLAKIVVRATEPDPERRYANAKQFATHLEQFLLSHFLFPDEEGLADYLVSLFPSAARHRWW